MNTLWNIWTTIARWRFEASTRVMKAREIAELEKRSNR